MTESTSQYGKVHVYNHVVIFVLVSCNFSLLQLRLDLQAQRNIDKNNESVFMPKMDQHTFPA